MRLAFELATVCADCFVGRTNTIAMFTHVDDIQFVKVRLTNHNNKNNQQTSLTQSSSLVIVISL